ncbi:MAG: ferredoxin reductase family protein [Candidatus Saccharimonadales bacterium]
MSHNQSIVPVTSRRMSLLKLWVIFIVNITIITYFWWRINGNYLYTSRGLFIGLGRITGLFSAFASLLAFVLISRTPFVDKKLSRENELRLHRWTGKATIVFLLLHVIFLIIGYASSTGLSYTSQLIDFINNYNDVFKALISSILFIVVGIFSIRIARRRLKYELWYVIHLTTYLAILLGFGHQLSIGVDFIRQRPFQLYWYFLYSVVFILVMVNRFIRPLYIAYRYSFRVEKVERDTDSIVSIYITGKNIHKFHFYPGQYAIWHFLQKKDWWQGHPFTFSSIPGGKTLRLTIRTRGDFTNKLAKIKIGTSVIIDGPYGNFIAETTDDNRYLFLAGGIGITPYLSMIPVLLNENRNIILIYTVRTLYDIPHLEELRQYEKHPLFTMHILDNKNESDTSVPIISQHNINKFVSDLSQRKIYVCGSEKMMESTKKSLRESGIPDSNILSEQFWY